MREKKESEMSGLSATVRHVSDAGASSKAIYG
jgi:hypothetical protein